MALLEVRKYPDEVLKKKAEPVDKISDDLLRLIDDMTETMYASLGVGLAAPQVGVSKRLIVVDVNRDGEQEGSPLLALFNPEIISAEGEIEFEEGCLSVPEFRTVTNRAEKIVVSGLDREGEKITINAEGLLAIAFQHEIDHLNGVLILDKSSFLKREFYKKRLKKQLLNVG